MKNYIIILLIISGLNWSCSDFLDQPPLDQIGIDEYWKSSIDLKNYVAKYYESLPKHLNSSHTVYHGQASDNVTYAAANGLLNGESTLSTGTWQSDFAPIRSINIFFDNYQKCEDPFSSWQHYLGEAQFFKAWMYFNLVQKYGDVPWYSHEITVDDEAELNRPRDPRTLVVDSILYLLDQAVINLDFRDNAEWNNNSINKEAALAFKTRVALFEGTWQKYHSGTAFGTGGAQPTKYFQACVDAATQLMDGSYNVGIYTNGQPEVDYYQLFGFGDMSSINEVLLYRAYSIGDFIGHNQNYYCMNAPNELGSTWSYVSHHLGLDGQPMDYQALAQTEKGNDFLLAIAAQSDPRLKQSILIPGQVLNISDNLFFQKPALFDGSQTKCPTGFQIKKFSNPATTMAYANANDAGRIVFRYAEVILNYAEALYELNGTVAYDALNQLRARVGMPDFQILSQESDPNFIDYGYPISDALYEIRRERNVEMAFELFREWDWKRWAAHGLFMNKRPKGYPFNPDEFPGQTPILDDNGLIDLLQGEIPSGYNFNPNRDYLQSIPQTERTLNPSLEQNPGWN